MNEGPLVSLTDGFFDSSQSERERPSSSKSVLINVAILVYLGATISIALEKEPKDKPTIIKM
jgi:hypothetical protein